MKNCKNQTKRRQKSYSRVDVNVAVKVVVEVSEEVEAICVDI